MTQDELNKKRDELAKEQGNRHASPVLRSMYPSKSRGQMSGEFAQLFSLGFDTSTAIHQEEIAKLKEACAGLVEALELINKGPAKTMAEPWCVWYSEHSGKALAKFKERVK